MRRILLSLLILALFCTGIVWASDAHVDLAPEHAATVSGCLYDAPLGDSDHHQNHGCHMSSHLVAMTSDSGLIPPLAHDAYFPASLQTLNSRHSAPPIRPPRV
ncbi:MAG: hypothetical protein L3K24_15465 [Gammaproteobacteria bacterium]|nr:hypothetical protein [Gammaproteobacteria bacterium]